MTDPAIVPTRLLKFMAGLARWSLGLLLAAGLLLTLAWGALHGWIVPRIGEYRAQIQAQASQALGVPVRVGAISARSEGLIPTIELENVALLDAEGREALRLPRVVVAVSPRSLWNFGFEQLYIERPELDVRRTADGRILLAGLELSGSSPDDGAAADWLFAQPELLIRGGTLRWTDELRGAPELARENRVLLDESLSRCREQADNRSMAAFSGVFWGFFGVVGGSAFGLFVLAPWLVSAGLVRVL